jgi:hypothetical protein
MTFSCSVRYLSHFLDCTLDCLRPRRGWYISARYVAKPGVSQTPPRHSLPSFHQDKAGGLQPHIAHPFILPDRSGRRAMALKTDPAAWIRMQVEKHSTNSLLDLPSFLNRTATLRAVNIGSEAEVKPLQLEVDIGASVAPVVAAGSRW